MSAKSTPSPRQGPTSQADEPQLPSGHCRYILLVPELKGQRCGCAHFNLNRSKPSAICECGHLACYHVTNGEPPSSSENQEMALLKQRLELLEREHVELHQLRRDFMLLQGRLNEDHDRNLKVVVRVSELEDTVEKSRADVSHEVQEAYKNLGRAWDSITDLMHHKRQTDNHFRHIDDRLGDVDREVARIGERQLELVDVDIALEERVENLEALEERIETLESNRRSQSSKTMKGNQEHNMASQGSHASRPLPLPPADNTRLRLQSRSRSPEMSAESATPTATALAISAAPAHEITADGPAASANHRHTPEHSGAVAVPRSVPSAAMPVRTATHEIGSGPTDLWTVHISLLPTPTQPFPFERDTNAYKRCLSRGLHQMVAVNGTTDEAFKQAISKQFGRILRGRQWVPLQALPCTAERLAGLPMLRPLEPSLVDQRYDKNFLRKHAAVLDTNGKIDSLYIAMRDKTLSWHSIRRLPVCLEGLEPSWAFDPLLDANDPFVDEDVDNDVSSSEDEIMGGMPRPPAGDIVATLPSLKRAASEMSRSSSFGSASAIAPAVTSTMATGEGEGSRPKVPRIYPLPNIVEVRRSVKTS